jgi:hypothetical protein
MTAAIAATIAAVTAAAIPATTTTAFVGARHAFANVDHLRLMPEPPTVARSEPIAHNRVRADLDRRDEGRRTDRMTRGTQLPIRARFVTIRARFVISARFVTMRARFVGTIRFELRHCRRRRRRLR